MAKRTRLNMRVVILVSVLAVILLGGGLYIYIKWLPENPELHAARAESILQENPDDPEWARVIREYRTAIEAAIKKGQPQQEAEYQLKLANLLWRRANEDSTISDVEKGDLRAQTFKSLRDLQIKAPDFLEAQYRRSELELLRVKQFVAVGHENTYRILQDYLKIINPVIKRDPKNALLYTRRGEVYGYLAATRPDEYGDAAIGDWAQAVSLEPENIDYWRGLLQACINLKRMDDLRDFAEKAVEANPDSAEVLTLKAMVLQRTQADDEEVISTLKAAVAKDPDDAKPLQELASFYLNKERLADAKTAIDRAKAIAPNEANTILLDARIAREEGQHDKSLEILEKGLARLNEETIGGTGNPDEELLRRRNRERARVILAYELARRYLMEHMMRGQEASLAKAKTFHETLLKLTRGTAHQLAISGQIAFADGEWNKALTELEAARAAGLYDTQMAFTLVKLYQRLGMPDKASREIARIQTLSGGNANPQFELEYIKSLIASRRYDDAYRRMEMLVRQQPENQAASQALWALDVLRGARTDLPPGELNVDVRRWILRRADDLYVEGRVPEAMDLLNKMLERDPTDSLALPRMVQILVAVGRNEDAKALLDQAVQAAPENTAVKQWRALVEADPDQRYAIELQFIDANTEDPLAAALEKYRIAQRHRRTDEALAFLREAQEIDPNDDRVVVYLLQAALTSKDWDQAQDIIDRMQRAGNPNWQLYRGRLLALQGEQAKAIADYQTVLERGDNQAARLWLADAYFDLENYEEAQKHFRAAWHNNNRLVPAMRGLAMVAERQQQFNEVERWVALAYEEPTGRADPWIREQYLQRITQRQDPKQAISVREARLRSHPDDMLNLFLLARLYESAQMNTQAEQMYRRGLDTTGQLQWAEALATHYRSIGKVGDGVQILQEMANRAPDDEAKARVYIAWGKLLADVSETEARHMFDKAIELTPNQILPYLAKVEFLSQLGARLNLTGQEAQAVATFTECAQLIEKTLEMEDDTGRRRTLYFTYVEAGQYDRAIRGFNQLLSQNASDTLARVGLGRAYTLKGDFPEAYDQFSQVLQYDPSNAEAYRGLASMYQRQGNWAQAFRAYQDAVRNAPTDIRLKMRLALLHKNAEQTQEAADLYLQIIDDNPRYKPAYQAMISLLRDAREIDGAIQWANRAMEAFPSDVAFAVVAARLHQAKGQWPNVVGMYQRALQAEPSNGQLIRDYLQALMASGNTALANEALATYQDYPGLGPVLQAIRVALQYRADQDADAAIPGFVAALKAAAAADSTGTTGASDISAVWAIMANSLPSQKLAANMTDIVKADERNWRLNMLASEAFQQLAIDEPKYYPNAEQWGRRAATLAGDRDARLMTMKNLTRLYETGRTINQYKDDYLPKLLETYRNILDIDRYDVAACNNLAYLYVDVLGRPQDALDLIERAMERLPGSSNLIDTHAWALATMGQYKQAEEKLQDVISRTGEKTSADVLYHMGFIKEKIGDVSEARRYYIRAKDRLGKQEDNPLRTKVDEALERVTRNSQAG